MTFGKVVRSVGAALAYFGIYIVWQFIVMFTAIIAVAFKTVFAAGMDIVGQITENGEYTYGEINSSITTLATYIDDTSAWLLEHTVHLTVISGILTLATYALIFAIRRKNVLREVGVEKMPVVPCLGMILLGAALNLSTATLLPFIPFPESWWNDYAVQTDALLGASDWLVVLLTVIIAPILEEVVFRGLVHTRLKRGMPMLASMIFSSWLFGLMHGANIAFIYASLLGFLLAWVFEKYKSLLAPIFLHLGFNLCAVVLDKLEDVPALVCVLAVVVSVLGISAVQFTAKGKIEVSFVNNENSDDASNPRE